MIFDYQLSEPVIDAGEHTSPAALPRGRIRVIGSGQTGCLIAEELREAGSEVFLACGRAPWLPRRMVGQDIVPSLHFCGVHFLCTRKSSLLFWVGQDARIVARSIGGR